VVHAATDILLAWSGDDDLHPVASNLIPNVSPSHSQSQPSGSSSPNVIQALQNEISRLHNEIHQLCNELDEQDGDSTLANRRHQKLVTNLEKLLASS
jgi:peptidoglycan hydrolase CwlO-like protein